MNPLKIYIVEDDPWYAEILEYHLSLNPDYEVEKFTQGKEFLKNLYKTPSVVTLDYSLPDISCEELIMRIKKFNPDLPVVVVSGQEDISTAVNLLKEGVYDYIVKDEDTKNRLWNVIKNIGENLALKSELSTLKEEVERKYAFEKTIIGNSPAIKKIFALMEKATKTNITVSVSGETGTGKELVAKAIHYNSLRSKEAFVAVNISAIPKELIESELFGHEKGAFTGAVSRRIGKFEQAHKGTLFLDEIGEMELSLQAKLLRVLQEKELTRVGGNSIIKTDVRVITATHKKLAEEVEKGNFRQDLYYRLLGLPIELPPLRERGNDILLLGKYFLDEFSQENQLGTLTLSTEAREKLLRYAFPGNVRELKAIIELAAVLTNSDSIDDTHITYGENNPVKDLLTEEITLKSYNQRIIRHFLDKYDNNVQLVAQKLDIGKSTLYRMIKNNEV